MSQTDTQAADNGPKVIDYQWHQSVPANDKQAVVALIRKVSATDPIVGFSDKVSEEDIVQYLEKLEKDLVAGRSHLMVGKTADNEVVCMVVLVPNGSPNNCHIADMSKGMISQDHRNSGILYDAFRSIVGKCRQHGVELLTLDVRDGTAARQVWLKCGFENYGMLDDYARIDGKIIAGHYMKQKVADLEQRLAQKKA